MKDEDGKITISRPHNPMLEDDYISIELKCRNETIVIEMELKEYAYAISGLSRQPVKIKRDS